jgi:hypothetical protein
LALFFELPDIQTASIELVRELTRTRVRMS